MSMADETTETGPQPQRKLRSACNSCHHMKVRCSGGTPCGTCENLDMQCVYSVSSRMGRPRGTKNKKIPSWRSNNGDTAGHSQGQAMNIDSGLPSSFGTNTMPSMVLNRYIDTAPKHDEGLIPPCGSTIVHDVSARNQLPLLQSEEPQMEGQDTAPPWLMTLDNPPSMPAFDLGLQLSSPTPPTSLELGVWPVPIQNAEQGFASLYPTPPPSNASSDGSVFSTLSSSGFDATQLSSRVPTYADNLHGPSPAASTNSWESSARDKFAECGCLSRQSELLRQLKEIQANPEPRVDMLLACAKQGIEAWQALLQCGYCQRNDSQDGLLLSTMCIRALVQATRGFSLRYQKIRSSSSTLTFTQPHRSIGSKNRHVPSEEEGPVPLVAGSVDPATHGETRTSIGVFEITGSDRTAVASYLLFRMLGEVKTILANLRLRMGSCEWDAHRRQNNYSAKHNKRRSSMQPQNIRDTFPAEEDEKEENMEDLEDEEDAAALDDDCDTIHILGLLKNLDTQVTILQRRLHDLPDNKTATAS